MVISGHEQVFKPNDSEVTERKMALKAINIQWGGGGGGAAWQMSVYHLPLRQ